MSQLQLVKVDLATPEICKPSDSIKFELVFENKKLLNEDVEFEVWYIGDTYNDKLDQNIGSNIIGPLEEGKLSFTLETNPVDLTKIPIRTLFGLTTILIVGKFKNNNFIRIGYVVDVQHEGVDSENLVEAEQVNEEGSEELGEEDEGEEECTEEENASEGIVDDEEASEDNEGSCDEEEEGSEAEECDEVEEDGCCNAGSCCNGGECCNAEDEYCCEKGSQCEGSNCSCNYEEEVSEKTAQYEAAMADALLNSRRGEIPMETPIVAGVDDFEYKGLKLKQSSVRFHFLPKPIVQTFEIDWSNEQEEEVVKESTESEENGIKKQKIE